MNRYNHRECRSRAHPASESVRATRLPPDNGKPSLEEVLYGHETRENELDEQDLPSPTGNSAQVIELRRVCDLITRTNRQVCNT